MKKMITICLVAVFMVFANGCMMGDGSGFEWGHTPHGHFDLNPTNLAPFGNQMFDGNGIIYTRKAGIIDPDHIWGCGRKTFSAYDDCFSALIAGKTEFTTHGIQAREIVYPAGWSSMSAFERKRLAQNLSLKLAETIGLHCEIPHELGTWWGGGIDYESSWSCEDPYSNALGAKLAMQAKKMEINGQGSATRNITILANKFMRDNQAVSASEAKRVSDSLLGTFWRKRPIQKAHLIKNVDIVGADGYIDNTPIPNFTTTPMTRIKAPRMDYSDFMGFKIDLCLSPSASYYSRTKRVLGLNRQVRVTDNVRFMQIIGDECRRKGYKVFE